MSKAYLFLLFFLAAWAGPAYTQDLGAKDRQAILAVLEAQNQAWNAGDIDRFMEGYWRSDSLVFVGSSGPTYGWEQTRQNYFRRYPDRQAMGQLTFTVVMLKGLDKRAAMMVGKWALKREIGDIGGYFTLNWRKINGKWLIVSDHTS